MTKSGRKHEKDNSKKGMKGAAVVPRMKTATSVVEN
jgi:hypothetical protein